MCSIWMAFFLAVSLAMIALPVCVLVSPSEIKLALGGTSVEDYNCSRFLTRRLIVNRLKYKYSIEFETNDLNGAIQEQERAGRGVTKVVQQVVLGMTAYVISGAVMLYSFWTTEACALACAVCA